MFRKEDLEKAYGPVFYIGKDSDWFMPGDVLRHRDNDRPLFIKGMGLCYKDTGEPIEKHSSSILYLFVPPNKALAFLAGISVGLLIAGFIVIIAPYVPWIIAP